MATNPAELLKGETAGVPNGVLAVVVLAGLGYAWYRKRQNATANTATTSGTASDGSTLNGPPSEFLPAQLPTENNTPTNQGFQSNADWTVAALKWSINNANKTNPPMNPLSAGTALGDYLAGNAVTQGEQDIINAVIVGIGPPPFPPQGNVLITPPPPPVAPPPTPTPTPPPAPAPVTPPGPHMAPGTWYTVKRGDNLTNIGKFFGRTWQQIYNANRDKIKNPNLIYPGQVLWIPPIPV